MEPNQTVVNAPRESDTIRLAYMTNRRFMTNTGFPGIPDPIRSHVRIVSSSSFNP